MRSTVAQTVLKSWRNARLARRCGDIIIEHGEIMFLIGYASALAVTGHQKESDSVNVARRLLQGVES